MERTVDRKRGARGPLKVLGSPASRQLERESDGLETVTAPIEMRLNQFHDRRGFYGCPGSRRRG
jgi:hypothetical protein